MGKIIKLCPQCQEKMTKEEIKYNEKICYFCKKENMNDKIEHLHQLQYGY